jgi:uncharacterized protein (DUF2126 family)
VLPIAWDGVSNLWKSSVWSFRRGRLYLLPGDSPMGLRLPLDSLPWVAMAERETPIAARHVRAARKAGRRLWRSRPALCRIQAGGEPHPEIKAQGLADAPVQVKVIHTALCVEARGGVLRIFMPPLSALEHYLELAGAIEIGGDRNEHADHPGRLRAAARLASATPDGDARSRASSRSTSTRPATGTTWSNIRVLYEEARLARLTTEKFMLDGRHTGTGGGNHVTLGGATPADSPMLRRPDLVMSLVSYWQHHPGLSYLFSGMFIGPTSQAPRVDEGRDEKLYELEIAFQQMPKLTPGAKPASSGWSTACCATCWSI